jgi:hypothetical protein
VNRNGKCQPNMCRPTLSARSLRTPRPSASHKPKSPSGLASTRRRCAKLKFCPRSQQLVPQKPHTLEPPETGAGGPAATLRRESLPVARACGSPRTILWLARIHVLSFDRGAVLSNLLVDAGLFPGSRLIFGSHFPFQVAQLRDARALYGKR